MALIGIVQHDHFIFTRLLLKSIAKYTDLNKHRVIIVDNKSDNDPLEYFKDINFIDKIIINDENNLPRAQNILIKNCNIGEDLCFLANDTVVSPHWLDYLIEDVYLYDDVGTGSPYMLPDLGYDIVINRSFATRYFQFFYERLRKDPTEEELEIMLNQIYFNDYEKFCIDFSNRNISEPPLDEGLTHIVYYKYWLFDKIGLYDEEYKPFGNEDRDFYIRMNNKEIFRIGSVRSYVHHWLSITDRQKFRDNNIPFQGTETSYRLLQKWEYIPGSEIYQNKVMPSRMKNWRTAYPKYKLREPMLSKEEAKKIDGLKYMMFEGKNPN